jgi:preprotein translocase subunit YajC
MTISARNISLSLRFMAFIIAGYFVFRQNKKTRKQLKEEEQKKNNEE